MRQLDLAPRKMSGPGGLVTDFLGHGCPSVQAAEFVFCGGLEMGNDFFLYWTSGVMCLFLSVCWRMSMVKPNVKRMLRNRTNEELTGVWGVAHG